LSLQLVVLSACIPMLFLAAIMEERSRAFAVSSQPVACCPGDGSGPCVHL
jgi:hypothetical protein